MITDDDISNMEWVIKCNLEQELGTMLVGVETLAKLLEEVKFRRQRQTELQETGTKLALRNRELEQQVKDLRSELHALNDFINKY